MKLVYLYIKEYGILKDVEFNFSANYKFHYNKNTKRLEDNSEELTSKLADNFFSVDKTKNVVTSVSALVGNNGAGKTTVFSYLTNLNSPRARVNNAGYILIYKIDGELFIDNNLDKSINFDKFNFSNSLLYDKNISTVYLSNYYCPAHYNCGDYDLSTSNLLQKDVGNLYKHDGTVGYFTEGQHKPHLENVIRAHEYLDLIRQIEFIKNKNDDDKIKLPNPVGVSINIEYTNIDMLESYLRECEENPHKKNDLVETLINKVIKCSDVDRGKCFIIDFIIVAFGDIVYKWFRKAMEVENQGQGIRNSESITTLQNLRINEKFDKPRDYYRILNDKLSSENVEEFRNYINEILQIMYKTKIISKNEINLFNNLCEALLKIEVNLIESRNLYFDLSKDSSEFINIAKKYFEYSPAIHFLKFDWDPIISSGEYAQFNIFSRLYSLKEKLQDNNVKNLAIFIDEIEITIHPSLQVGLVSNLIKFFETYFSEYKVHLIFGTHSPILLSDIPKSNVTFLKRKSDEEIKEEAKKKGVEEKEIKIVEAKTDIKMDNTFGANIHSLYRESFFMEHGSMGEFATDKINGIIGQLNNKESNPNNFDYNELEQQINLIGEPVIRNTLMKQLHAKSDISKKIAYHEKQLEQLKKSQGANNAKN